ncbi:hypothetical protein C8J56DRAFT_1049951 [Mycena floridula]|nr:hypothetical protein C8J56DRAFT_1049951 [Mycena floridula]
MRFSIPFVALAVFASTWYTMASPITHVETALKSKLKSASRTRPSDSAIGNLVPLIQDKAEQAAVKKLLLSIEEGKAGKKKRDLDASSRQVPHSLSESNY